MIFNKSDTTNNPEKITNFKKIKSVDIIGKPHFDKNANQLIETPHVHDATGTRSARPDELPKKINKIL